MRWENWAAITLCLAIGLALNGLSGARFDDPMVSLMEAIGTEPPQLQARPAERIWPAGPARL